MKTPALRPTLLAIALCFGVVASLFTLSPTASAQTNITGAIAGSVFDSTGALIPGASVTVSNPATGSVYKVTASSSGTYQISLLKPGVYTVLVGAPGFKDVSATVTVGLGQVATTDIHMTAGSATQVVEVTAAAPILQTDSAEISTQFGAEQVQTLPNPGNDLTFYAQTTPGANMNTQGGYGNFEVFGLPATSNNFMLNGGLEDDPFLNLNNSGPSNLLLGTNDIAEVNVVTNAYSSVYGSFGGAQISEISRSGTNHFHGNVGYWYNWTGLNANNWFLDNQGSPRPGDVSNQWAAAVGGPIVKDKSFFFVDYEGIRFTTSNTEGVYVPSPAFQAYTLASIKSSPDAEVASEYNFYKNNIFGTYNGASGISHAVATSDPAVVTFESASKLNLHEWFLAGRYDQNIGENDKLFFHVKIDKGVQPTYSDPLNPIFDASSVQPDYESQLGFTHTFNANMVNQFLLTGSYYGAIFKVTNAAGALAVMPEVLDFIDGTFTTIGGEGFAFPQGRNVSQFQIQDDFSYTKGKQTLKAGVFFKKDNVSDFDMQEFTNPPLMLAESEYYGTFPQGGVLEDYYDRNLLNPSAGDQPVGLYALGAYFEDQWKLASNFQVNAGIRMERDSDPNSTHGNFVRLASDFYTVTGSTNTTTKPFSSFITTGHQAAFVNYTPAMFEPRIGFIWSPKGAGSHTVLRGGFGMFTDIFPGVIADNLFGNYPFTLNAGTSPDLNYLIGPNSYPTVDLTQPSLPDSAYQMDVNQANIYKNGFNKSYASLSGSSVCPMCTGYNAGVAPPNFTSAATHIHYPTYEEYSLQLQQQLGKSYAMTIGYVGNRGYHEPIQNENVNAYDGAFTGLPTAPPAGGLAFVNQIQSTGVSDYSGLVTSLTARTHYFTAQLNYTYSHALDDVSNGGISPYSFASGLIGAQIDPYNLKYNYGNADYDSRHTINANYLLTLPYWGGPHALTDGWQISGTIFFNDGYPFTLVDSAATPIAFGEYFSSAIPAQISGPLSRRCSKFVNSGDICSEWATSLATTTTINPATSFGTQERNQFLGPRYFDTDFAVLKSFNLPLEGTKFKVGAQLFNILNHPNFSQPGADANSVSFGTITSTVNPPTSIFGAFLGGDASPRIVQLKGSIVF